MGLFKELLDELDEIEDIEARILNGQYEDPNEGGPVSGRTVSDIHNDIINAVNVNVLLYDSAHELLELCEELFDLVQKCCDSLDYDYDRITGAIKKAKGES